MFSSPTKPVSSPADRAAALLLGLNGLALLVVFPLGPQESRLWHPGVPGVAALAAAFPLAAALAGLLARRIARLPASPRALAALAFVSTLPCAFAPDYASLVAARVLAGLAAGISAIALHRSLSPAAAPLVAHIAPRVTAFGMPVCLLAATALDWRYAFAPILTGQLVVWLSCRSSVAPAPAAPTLQAALAEPAPCGLVANAALAFVTAAYLTILSGFLVFNAGHTEFHIPVVLLAVALLGLAAAPLVGLLRARLRPPVFFAATLLASAANLLALLLLRDPLPAPAAVACIAVFLVVGSTRHLGLAALVAAKLPPAAVAAHQAHGQLAHLLGMGLGACAAGLLITLTPEHTLAGMPALLGASLAATALAWITARAAAQRTAMPAPDSIASSEMRAPS